jgi:DNA-binding response OmpR family regulator
MGCAECDHGGSPRRRVPERRVRVLIADSDTVTRRLIAISLLLEGFDAVPVTDSGKYLDALAPATPDVIVINMSPRPPEALSAVIDSLRRLDPSLVKLLLISPAALAEATSCEVRSRADACLTTPFDPAEMIRVVRELTGRQSGHNSRQPVL